MSTVKQNVKSESLNIEKAENFINLSSDIIDSEKNNTGFLIKNFFKTDADWNSIVDLIHSESQRINKNLEDNVAASVLKSGIDEKVYGNVLVVEGLYHSIRYPTDDKQIASMKEVDETLAGLSRTSLVDVSGKVIKISMGSRIVESHKDQWGALIFHLIGKSTWYLTHTDSGYEDSFIMEPGDLLYFPKEMFHKIVSNSARASVIVPVSCLDS